MNNRSYPSRIIRYRKILEYNNIKSYILGASDLDFWKKVRTIDYFIFPLINEHSQIQLARTVLPVIENIYKKRCFPDQATSWHYDDKIRQYYLLYAHGFPVVDTWVFWDQNSALDWIESATFPLVFKLKSGAASSNVVLIRKKSEAKILINKMFSSKGVTCHNVPSRNSLTYLRNLIRLYGLRRYIALKRGRLDPEKFQPFWQVQRDYVLFQKFLPDNAFDVRVTVIGARAFAFLRYVRPNDFRASGSGLIDYDTSKIDMRCVEIAFRISEKMKFQSMAYDFIFDEEGEPMIAEISYTFVDTAVYNCPGYFDKSLKWHEGRYWPQYCQLAYLIKEIQLNQPPEDIMAL